MFTDPLPYTHTHTQSLHLLKNSGANRKQAYADREEFTDRRASYKRREKKPNQHSVHWRKVCTNRKQQDYMHGRRKCSEQLTPSSWGSTYSSSPTRDREWMALASTGRYIHTQTQHNYDKQPVNITSFCVWVVDWVKQAGNVCYLSRFLPSRYSAFLETNFYLYR